MKAGSIIALLVSILAGCSVDRGANPFYGCTSNGDCDGGVCHAGFCVAPGGPTCAPEDACYGGPEGTRGMGVCRAGCTTVVDGGSECRGEVQPSDEICNGADDDCDGTPDEGFTLDTTDQCGSCDTHCAVGEECCGSSGGGHECANLSSSPDHCGDCGTRCDAGQACCGALGCIDVQEDESNCGACGNVCGAGLECCGGRCVNPRSSNDHCGACDNACAGTDASTCCPAESDGVVDCRPIADCATCTGCDGPGQMCCGGECADSTTDPLNCGGCGVACGADQRCCGGTCVALHEACSACGSGCGDSELCCAESCVSRTAMTSCGGCGVMCASGQTCCASGCTDLSMDDRNCGACGVTCVGQVCSNGGCCDAGLTWCGDAIGCVSTAGNKEHCGDCDMRCTGLASCNRGLLGDQPWGCRTL